MNLKYIIYCFIGATILIWILHLFGFFERPDESLRMKYYAASIASLVAQYGDKYGVPPLSIKDACINEHIDEYPDIKRMKFIESKEYDGSGGWVYSPESLFIQSNDKKYQNIKIFLPKKHFKLLYSPNQQEELERPGA